MTIDDYKKNLRGVNDGADFSPEFLVRANVFGHFSNHCDTLLQQNIYDSIRKREIIMPEEHTGQLGFEYAWKELLTRSRQTGPFYRIRPLTNLILYSPRRRIHGLQHKCI